MTVVVGSGPAEATRLEFILLKLPPQKFPQEVRLPGVLGSCSPRTHEEWIWVAQTVACGGHKMYCLFKEGGLPQLRVAALSARHQSAPAVWSSWREHPPKRRLEAARGQWLLTVGVGRLRLFGALDAPEMLQSSCRLTGLGPYHMISLSSPSFSIPPSICIHRYVSPVQTHLRCNHELWGIRDAPVERELIWREVLKSRPVILLCQEREPPALGKTCKLGSEDLKFSLSADCVVSDRPEQFSEPHIQWQTTHELFRRLS